VDQIGLVRGIFTVRLSWSDRLFDASVDTTPLFSLLENAISNEHVFVCPDNLGEWAWFVATPLFSLCENAIAKEPGSSYPE
jgi:hypothetical protein